MLENQKWMCYALSLPLEWKQAKDEGKDVDDLKEMCALIAKTDGNADDSALAEAIRAKLLHAKVAPDYPFHEPSDLDAIHAARPERRHCFSFQVPEEEVKDKLAGAWMGRISGCLLGKPVEGMKRPQLTALLKGTNNLPMHKYICKKDFTDAVNTLLGEYLDRCWADTLEGAAPMDDDTNYTVLALKLIENYGTSFTPNDVLEAWLTWMPMFSTCTAERVAYRNAAMGLFAPQTATHLNPYREWIGAQIRGDFFGYINPANPQAAAEMAWKDASISHVKNGIYGEMFVAAMIAAAAVSSDTITIVEAGLDEIPHHCRLRRDIEQVLAWYGSAVPAEKVVEHIHTAYDEQDEHGWCHTNPNAMIVVMALLYGKMDFGKTICLSVEAAFDTDCNGATVGSIVGMMLGARRIPQEWNAPYQSKLFTSISGYAEVTIDQLVEKTMPFVR